MGETQEIQFSEMIKRRLVSEGEEVISLWKPIAQEFDRNGPDAAKLWLDALRQGLENKLESLIDQVEE